MNILALIPARSGSKRVPNKNIRHLQNKPLLAWSILFARSLPDVSQVVVSTDSVEIASISRDYGAMVPGLRPSELSGDHASTNDVINYTLKSLIESGHTFDLMLLLQPTSPFRDNVQVQDALKASHDHQGYPVISLCQSLSHPDWCYVQRSSSHFVQYTESASSASRSQDLSPLYEASGNFYISGVNHFLRHGSFFSLPFYGVISSSRFYDIDIDDEYDWFVAESISEKFPHMLNSYILR